MKTRFREPRKCDGMNKMLELRLKQTRVSGLMSSVDVDGGGQAGSKDYASRNVVDLDADRNALRQLHPGKDRVDGSHPLSTGLRV